MSSLTAALYPTLRRGIEDLVSSYAGRSQAASSSSAPIPTDELSEKVKDVWSSSYADEDEAEGSQSRKGDIVRSVMDLVGRDVVVSPLVNGELPEPDELSPQTEKTQFQTALQDRLDTILTLYEVVYAALPDYPALEPGAVFIPVLEELVELISVETWRDLWGYVETRSKRFTKDMPASKGKALPLLRTINAFLRFLPRTPADLVFRGRVHQFASSVIGIADKSAINMRGDYGEIKTTWDEPERTTPIIAENGEAEDGDVKMDGDNEKKEVEDKPTTTETDSTPEFYSTLWSLQHYFASPPSLAAPSPPSGSLIPAEPSKSAFDDFKVKSDFVLPKLFEQTLKERAQMGVEKDGSVKMKPTLVKQESERVGRKRKRGGVKEEEQEKVDSKGKFFHPRYLTGKRLLEHELADVSFRRQILVQYFILFQFLLNLTPSSASKQAFTGGMPRDFVVDQEKETWVKSKITAIRDELRRMPPDGTRFEEVVLSIITRERHYAQWKNENCPEGIFEVQPMDTSIAMEAAKDWNARLRPPPRYRYPVGSESLSRLWYKGFTDIDQLKGWKRKTTVESLTEELRVIEAEEEDDKAMGIQPDPEKAAANAELKTNLNWRALRLASHRSLKYFGAFSKRRHIQELDAAIKKEEELVAARAVGENTGDKDGGANGAEGENNGHASEEGDDGDALGVKFKSGEGEADPVAEEDETMEDPAPPDAAVEAEGEAQAAATTENETGLGEESKVDGDTVAEAAHVTVDDGANGDATSQEQGGDVQMDDQDVKGVTREVPEESKEQPDGIAAQPTPVPESQPEREAITPPDPFPDVELPGE